MEEQDRRLTHRLLNQWEMTRGSFLPPIDALNRPAILEAWPNCVLARVEFRTRLMYKCEHMGAVIAEACGRDLTGIYLPTTSSQFPAAVMFNKMDAVLDEYRPLLDSGHFFNEHGKVIKYRVCFLPFSADGKVLTHILVALSFREL